MGLLRGQVQFRFIHSPLRQFGKQPHVAWRIIFIQLHGSTRNFGIVAVSRGDRIWGAAIRSKVPVLRNHSGSSRSEDNADPPILRAPAESESLGFCAQR